MSLLYRSKTKEIKKMENQKTNQETATNIAVILAEWTLERLKEKDPRGGKNLEKRTKSYHTSDCLRLEETTKYPKENQSYDNATELTNLSVGLMKIYENHAYTQLTERRCE